MLVAELPTLASTGSARHATHNALSQVADGPPYISVRRPLDRSVKSPLQGAVIPRNHVRRLYQRVALGLAGKTGPIRYCEYKVRAVHAVPPDALTPYSIRGRYHQDRPGGVVWRAIFRWCFFWESRSSGQRSFSLGKASRGRNSHSCIGTSTTLACTSWY